MKRSIPQTFLRIGSVVTLMAGPMMLLHTPAHAADPGPDVDVTGNTVSIKDGVQGGGGGYIPSDPNWETIARFPDQPCVDRNNNISYGGIVRDTRSGATLGSAENPYCLTSHYGNGTDVAGFVKKAVPAPKPRANFQGDFLTGAPIQFSSTDLRDYTVNLPGFPGAYAVITALDITWDFGDGTTSKDLDPVHTYENIAPNQSNKDLHKVHVTVTGTWHVVFHDPNIGELVDYGNLTGTGFLDRSIDQVWSKQMEPNS